MKNYAIVSLLLIASCSAPQEWVKEYDGYLPGADAEEGRIVVLSVRDAETGDPIASARVRQHVEFWPSKNAKWAETIAEATTDEYGLAWIESDDGAVGCHWAVHADGYASVVKFGRNSDGEVQLGRGGSYHGRLLDSLGSPLAGVNVEYILGCPHSPSLARAVTDASGRFEFAHVRHGQWAISHPGVEAAYVLGRSTDLPAPVFATMPARQIEGRLLRADGSAAPWAVIQNFCSPRGPLTLVERDGRFKIRSGEVRSGLTAYVGDERVDLPIHAYPGEFPFTFVVGAQETGAERTVLVSTKDDLELNAVLVRKNDGRAVAIKTDIEADVLAGEYRVEVGTEFTRYRMSADVPADGKIMLDLKEQAQLQLTFDEAGLAADVSIRLLLDGTWTHLEVPYDEPIYLPRAGRAVLLAELDGARAWLPIGPTKKGRRSVTVRLPPQKRLRLPGATKGAFVEVYGAVHGDITWQAKLDGEIITLRATGKIVVEYNSVRAEFDVPEMADAVLEPTRIVNSPAAEDYADSVAVRILLPDGSPAFKSEVWVNGEQSLADEDGIAWVSSVRDGNPLILRQQRSSFASRRITLHGDGPYTVQWGACSIRFAIPGVEEPLVWMDGALRSFRDDAVIEGLTPGPHTLIIGAPGRKHYVMRVVLKPGETRLIDLALPRISARRSAPR